MPSSPSESIPYEIEFIRKNQPNLSSVLDVGIGFGKGGFLLREYYDVKQNKLYQPQNWKLKITGVEIFKDYISDLQKIIYNQIIFGDIFTILPKLGRFDLAILAEIIEHFPKSKGFQLLDLLLNHVQDIVITTPNGFLKHNNSDGNIHEDHLSGWTIEDFTKYNIIDSAKIKRLRKNEEILVVYLRK